MYGFELKWDVGTIVTGFGFLFACLSFYWQGRRDTRNKRREIYQNLELASVDIFRFEAQNSTIVEKVWFAGKLPKKGTVEYETVRAYVYQILNLFEMAVRFRRQGIMPNDVFGSWVIWFYDLCSAPGFSALWPDMRWNYLPELREILTEGLTITSRHDAEAARQKFFEFMATQFRDKSIRLWLTERH
jgi:hypothetical protein